MQRELRQIYLLVLVMFVAGWIVEIVGANDMETYKDFQEVARKKKSSKYIGPLLLTAVLLKAILLPLAFKVMAVMSTIAVFISVLSLVMSSIVGYTKLAWHVTKSPSLDIYSSTNPESGIKLASEVVAPHSIDDYLPEEIDPYSTIVGGRQDGLGAASLDKMYFYGK